MPVGPVDSRPVQNAPEGLANSRISSRSSNLFLRMVRSMFMRVKSRCAHQLRPPRAGGAPRSGPESIGVLGSRELRTNRSARSLFEFGLLPGRSSGR
jgi:hypothetical protein